MTGTMIAFQNSLPPERLGAGMGLVSLFREFGLSVGTPIVGAIAADADIAAHGQAWNPVTADR